MPRVSVIIPIYNVEKYLEDCLKSLVHQTLQDIEIICVNDGSTDSSLSIIQEYALKDRRIKVIDKINTGYGDSMNTGLDHATGDYIGIVESDDFASLDMFEKLYDAAQKNSVEVVKSNYFEYVDNTDVFIENLKGCNYKKVFSPMAEEKVFFIDPSIWSGIYKRSFLINNNIRFNETPGASYQDTSFAFKVWISAEKVFLIKDAFLHYRKDNMNSSVNSASKIFCVCDEYMEIERFLESHLEKKIKLASLILAKKFKSYKWNYNRLISPFQYTFLLRMAEEFKKTEEKYITSTEYLNTSELNELYNIIHNTDKYFKDTAKDYSDDRLLTNITLNLQFYKEGFLGCICRYKKIIIFGAGSIGKQVAQNLILEENIKHILCFAVSELNENPELLLEIPVYSIYDLGKHIDDSVVLVAIRERDQYEIINTLKTLKFKNIISIDSLLLNELNGKK